MRGKLSEYFISGRQKNELAQNNYCDYLISSILHEIFAREISCYSQNCPANNIFDFEKQRKK